jgi:alkylation response protein AidB-like acyl-CoA dehydrogenase
MPYRAPVDQFRFLLEHVVGFDAVRTTDMFADATPDTTDAILTEAGRFAEEVFAPVQRAGDLHPARLENGVVRTPPGYAEAFRALSEGGWVATSAPAEYGGMGLPLTLTTAINEMLAAACLGLELTPLMSQGQIEALHHHASPEIKALYLPRLISGEWTGTMNLTEPQAGSDVGALRTRAVPNGDGTYAITGQKIYISGGDNDFTTNICHLVLARLPDGVPGTKGISLFLVPKRIPDADGTPGAANSLRVVSLEHKMGLHGSATCVMDYDGATGWLIGPEHGGMACMFTMMNNARLGVGVQGLGAAEGALQHAMAFALDRRQGRPLVQGGTGAIVDHADVRRMLMTMKAEVHAARAIALANAVAIDMASATGDAAWAARAALLTPITKAYGTDTGCRVADMGIQVHGGMGFVEETGAAQYLRDVRVTAIYEGTNGIQSMDLVGRKMMDGGAEAFRLLDEIAATAATARDSLPDLSQALDDAAATLRRTVQGLVAEPDLNDRFAGSVPFLRAFALVLGAQVHLKSTMAEGGTGPRTALARFHILRLLPEHAGLCVHALAGAGDLYAMTAEELAA